MEGGRAAGDLEVVTEVDQEEPDVRELAEHRVDLREGAEDGRPHAQDTVEVRGTLVRNKKQRKVNPKPGHMVKVFSSLPLE